ncbi:hypothetical protein COB57_01485 [Candidatus Peregrinibacteria bacterium]|nr:MAG: hypothetical protein COB57_01485 [Candidatus Peregrinibacteria bacterium]
MANITKTLLKKELTFTSWFGMAIDLCWENLGRIIVFDLLKFAFMIVAILITAMIGITIVGIPVAIFIFLVATHLVMASSVMMFMRMIEEKTEKTKYTITEITDFLKANWFWTFVASFLYAILTASGNIFSIILGLVLIMYFMFNIPLFIASKGKLKDMDSLIESMKLVQGQFWRTFGFYLGKSAIMTLFVLIMIIISALIVWGVIEGGAPDVIVFSLLGLLWIPIVYFLSAVNSAMHIIYFYNLSLTKK